ncbi:hypothetical protein [Streptomyces sp. NRRL B-24572]|uniref:hypothetical protein n=1 Tax=Streptomyces sp. NRRL B-24572 TaxID=1962156 RepID=UPI000A3997E4|nr:hypothetical protein [Streptomyces sp. NRRL B-24572]
MALALTACGRLTVMPPPEGEPVILKPADFLTTWTDADGGTITLKKDGTFVADKICVGHRWDEGLAWSGTGTWKQGSNKEESFLHVTFDEPHPVGVDPADPDEFVRETDGYTALKDGRILKLWTAVGDPDNDCPNCVLTSPAS